MTALLAMKTGRPVKLVYNRREDIVSSRTRHGMEIKIKTGVKKDGTIISQDMQVIINAGAYAGGTMSIVWAMSGKFFKNHKTPNIRFQGHSGLYQHSHCRRHEGLWLPPGVLCPAVPAEQDCKGSGHGHNPAPA